MTQKAVKRTPKGKEYKMIAVSPDTHLRLEILGNKGESFDSIIKKLLPAKKGGSIPVTQISEVKEIITYQCSECGVHISTVVDPKGFECPDCHVVPTNWRTGEF